jgi:2-polyprenyl-6-methoxyphenol hydroxylase-like FAD-dependent oxidoreductase
MEHRTSEQTITTRCCVVGGGPAGMMLGLLLARAGVQVAVLEKHADFLRDFRGDTVHPSTLEILDQIGLKSKFDQIPQQRVEQIKAQFADGLHPVVDFRKIRPFPYIALVPQWDFLDFLADEARKYPTFQLFMNAEATTLLYEGNHVTGVVAQTPQGQLRVRADVVVGCDGRHSTVRAQSGLETLDLGAPMDVLWFRLPRASTDTDEFFGIIGRGHFIALLQRGEYWQMAYVIPKGAAESMRTQPIETFRAQVAKQVPFLADRTGTLGSWDDVKLLEVHVDRLKRWFEPGLLCIGDAAHAMSPIGGVGINLAIQDAVAAANALAPALQQQQGAPSTRVLAGVQLRRELPTRVVQGIQVQAQNRVIAPTLRDTGDGGPREMPGLLRSALQVDAIRAIPARIFGLGVRRERVRIPARAPAESGVRV